MSGKLFIVATPIGNLGDIGARAIEILRSADIIAAEDTRTSMALTEKFGIKTKLAANHKFNESGSCDYFLGELLSGKNIAVISDAGTPCISDPGALLVKKAVENNIAVVAIPGACAAVAALSVAGFEIKSFTFEGFFPRGGAGAKKTAQKLLDKPGVYIFYESPKRIIKTFEVFAKYLPDSDFCLCNDLTKKFERIYRGAPAAVLDELRDNPSAEKGEYTVVIDVRGGVSAAPRELAPEAAIVDVMVKENCGVKDAVNYIAALGAYGFGKNELYAASLNLKKMFGG